MAAGGGVSSEMRPASSQRRPAARTASSRSPPAPTSIVHRAAGRRIFQRRCRPGSAPPAPAGSAPRPRAPAVLARRSSKRHAALLRATARSVSTHFARDLRRDRRDRTAARARRVRSATATSRSSISRRMRSACTCIMPRKRSRSCGVVARGAGNGFDQQRQRRQRRAQFVAGVGEEIGAHALGADSRGLIVKNHQRGALVAPSHRRDIAASVLLDLVGGSYSTVRVSPS